MQLTLCFQHAIDYTGLSDKEVVFEWLTFALNHPGGEKITKDRLRPVILVSDILPRLESGGFGRPTTRNE